MSRKKSRVGLVQLMFQSNIQDNFSEEMVDLFLDNMEFTDSEKKYISTNYMNLISHLEDIDEIISDHVKGWSIDRLSSVDLSVLRVSIYEIYFGKDVPAPVSINEAVEISKTYGTKDSGKFVNGILGTVYRSLNK